jgi:hypothetical protein
VSRRDRPLRSAMRFLTRSFKSFTAVLAATAFELLVLAVGDGAMNSQEGDSSNLPLVQPEFLQILLGEGIFAHGECESKRCADDLRQRQARRIEHIDHPLDPGSLALDEPGPGEELGNLWIAVIGVVLLQDCLEGDAFGEAAGVVEANRVVEDPDLGLDLCC